MRGDITSNNDKNDLKPQTNTLETNTIRLKSWRNTLLSNKRAPALAIIAAGFFIASILGLPWLLADRSTDMATALNSKSSLSDQETDLVSHGTVLGSGAMQASIEEMSEANTNDERSQSVNENSSYSVSISSHNSSAGSSTNSLDSPSSPKVEFNGRQINIPDNGRYRQTIEDENSTARIRSNISGGGSDISISITSKTSEEAP